MKLNSIGKYKNMSDVNSLELSKFLPYRLAVLSNIVGSTIAKSYEEKFNLSIPEWRIIAVLERYPEVSAQDIGDKTAMDKVAVSRAVNRLIASNRVVREFSKRDKRMSILSLSIEGHEIYKEIVPEAKSYEASFLSVLSVEEQENLDKIMDKLFKQAKELKSR